MFIIICNIFYRNSLALFIFVNLQTNIKKINMKNQILQLFKFVGSKVAKSLISELLAKILNQFLQKTKPNIKITHSKSIRIHKTKYALLAQMQYSIQFLKKKKYSIQFHPSILLDLQSETFLLYPRFPVQKLNG